MLLGRELGLSWIQAIRGIYVLPNGQPGLRGTLLLARIRAAGHRYAFSEGDDFCEFAITRKDEEFKVPYTGRFSLEDAKAAGLVREHDGKLVARSRSGEPLPWELYRRDMLQWRAVARGAARGCPELIFGFDLAGIGDGEDGGAVTAEVLPQPAAPQNGQQQAEDMRSRLEQLDREHGGETPPEPPNDAAAAEQPRDMTVAPEARAPGLPELHELLRRCGFTGHQQTSVCAVLAHRDITDMGQLTPGEVFMIHNAVTQIAAGHGTMRDRHDALERYLDNEREADDEQPDQHE
jgi:hypothetical protein